jgi:hypothetical protein
MPETANQEVVAQLKEILGDYFAAYLSGDQTWSLGVLRGSSQGS